MTAPSPQRVLLVRLSALGDIVHTMPVACALKDAMPDVHLTWLTQEGGAPLLEGHRAIDEVLTVPRRWMKSLSEILKVRRTLRERRFDTAIDGQGLLKSASLAWLSGAKRRIGMAKPWGREGSPWLMTETVDTTDFGHIIERNLRVLEPLGISDLEVRFDMPRFDEPAKKMSQWAKEQGVADGFVMLNVGAGWPSKRWPTDRFARVAKQLADAYGLKSIVTFGGGEEKTLAEEVIAGAPDATLLAPKMTLQELVELMRLARLFVGSDTGPLHMAAAAETPCVGLYGPFPAERHGPYGPLHVSVQKMCLEGSVKERRNAGPESMEAIDVASVVEACVGQLAKKSMA